ncbi:hypothetical protein CCL17_12430 [Pseudomonas congelans]|uniref:hypothetical protein n=1 Tax=Pseudomonas congelans TaxID=200452 RepID=UPI000BB5F720|nr:hypothetical protein [Pseudomonas congelans]PBQ02343.1 hypothetical protein CCL17_12430 [Pseudomonas congelans]PBQ16822.1 hypothetical protein CCL08_15310 [Pseudomonas congelans]
MSSHHCRIENGNLWIGSQRVCLPYPADTFLLFQGIVLIRLESPPGEGFNRNIFAVSMAGEVLWQIEEGPHGTQADKPFMSLHCDDNAQVIAGCWNGVTYSVNVENGKIQVIQFDK